MAIEVIHDKEPRWWPAEQCCFCYQPTRFWYAVKDVAVCQTCAETHEPEDVPEKTVWCAAVRKREASRQSRVVAEAPDEQESTALILDAQGFRAE